MQTFQRHELRHLVLNLNILNPKHCRHASLTSAISRGLRKGANSLDRLGTTRRTPGNDTLRKAATPIPPRSRLELDLSGQIHRKPNRRFQRELESRAKISYEAPQGVPYSTAESEFLYGTFAVKAALEAGRRRLHKIYIWKGEQKPGDEFDVSISRLAKSMKVPIQEVAGSWEHMMLKMSGQRPHNGYILEASAIPKIPAQSLENMENPKSDLKIAVGGISQSGGSAITISRPSTRHRYPLLLLLDRVTDMGNLGAIIRSAYFFGVDAVIIPEHGTAPFSPVTVKASAGTAEHVPILTVKKELEFVQSSRKNGWKFFAAVSPESTSTKNRSHDKQSLDVANALNSSPCVIMLGNEAEGLRGFMQKAADEPISIRSPRNLLSVVDSLNVSVAAALLMARFLTPTPTTHVTPVTPNKIFDTADDAKSSQ